MAMTLHPDTAPEPVTRRHFLEKALIGAGVFSGAVITGTVGGVIIDGGAKEGSSPTRGTAGSAAPTPGHEGMVMATGSAPSETSAPDMDAMHKQGVEDFLRNQKTPLTKGKGNLPLEPRIENGVKVFN